MKLWLLTRTDHWSYGDFDSAVVAAETEDAARNTTVGSYPWTPKERYHSWTGPDNISVTLLGDAAPEIEAGAILCSFNAG